jgi:hypothetical protein
MLHRRYPRGLHRRITQDCRRLTRLFCLELEQFCIARDGGSRNIGTAPSRLRDGAPQRGGFADAVIQGVSL